LGVWLKEELHIPAKEHMAKKKIVWHLEKRKISSLISYFKNPRQLTKDQETHLKTSLEKFGLIDRPCINTNGMIIGGHQRVAILKNEEEIEVWIPNRLLDNAEVEELNIRLNKNLGEWDWDILANEFETSDLLKWGFNEKDLQIEIFDDEKISKIDDNESQDNKKEKKCPKCGFIYGKE
jgi:hypothetical protein